jgi:hypothetical protein
MLHAQRLAIGTTGNALGNTAATSSATIDGLVGAVVLDQAFNVGNSHNIGSAYATSTGQYTGVFNAATGAGSLNKMTLANQFGEEFTYYNTAINTSNTANPVTTATYASSVFALATGAASGRNHINLEIRLVIKNERRHMPVPTTGGPGSLPMVAVGFALLITAAGWQQLRNQRELGYE